MTDILALLLQQVARDIFLMESLHDGDHRRIGLVNLT